MGIQIEGGFTFIHIYKKSEYINVNHDLHLYIPTYNYIQISYNYFLLGSL